MKIFYTNDPCHLELQCAQTKYVDHYQMTKQLEEEHKRLKPVCNGKVLFETIASSLVVSIGIIFLQNGFVMKLYNTKDIVRRVIYYTIVTALLNSIVISSLKHTLMF